MNFRMLFAWSRCAADRMAVLYFFAPIINRWLDRTRIEGSKRNQRTARRLYRDFASVADFSMIRRSAGSLKSFAAIGG